jgi:hypothetical protein
MTIEEINLLLEEYRDAADKADRLSDKLDRNPLYTKEMVQKVDKARLELENKIAELKAKRKELQNNKETPAPTPTPTEPEKPTENTDNNETKPEPTPEPEKERTEILLSVGVGGKNNLLDVKLVQKLLNERKGCKLDTDGVCGNLTITQIIDLQRRIFQSWAVDGRIDPGGKTWKWLAGKDALPKLPPPPPQPIVDPIIRPKPDPIKNPTVQEKIVDVLGVFADLHLPYEKEFFRFDWPSKKVWLGYGFFIDGGLFAYANASLDGKKETNSITVTGTAQVACGASVSIGWGEVSQGWYGTYGLEARGTLSGKVAASFRIISKLSASGQTMTGSLKSNADITASLYVSAKIKGGFIVGGEYQTEEHNLGSITFLYATTPMYSMNYNFSARKFSFNSSGKWAVTPHPMLIKTLKAYIRK